jgi:protein-S-isoprenylcysteine O-methyltransferase Ste14
LQTGGPYHFIRHPGYAGYLLLCLGLGVGFNSYLGLAAGVILLLPGLIYRMYVEEELLINQFGDEYRAYAVRTKRLIPGVW